MLDWLGSRRQDPNCVAASNALESAISAVTRSGVKTPDIGGNSSTDVVTKAVCAEIRRQIEPHARQWRLWNDEGGCCFEMVVELEMDETRQAGNSKDGIRLDEWEDDCLGRRDIFR